VTLFDITSAYELTGKQRIEQAANICSDFVFDELRIKLRVVSDLDWPRCFEKSSERVEIRVVSKIFVAGCAERVKVDNGNTFRRGELN